MRLRPAEPSDADQVARVHVRSWQAGYRDLLPDDYLDGLKPEDRAARYTFGDPSGPMTVVAVDGGEIRGFATVGPAPDADIQGSGELAALYVDPACWRGGIGRQLIGEARRLLAGQGFAGAALWVLAGNERAERFYLADGWTPDGARRRVEVWGVMVDEVRYRRGLP